MISGVNQKIIVSVNLSQKDTIEIGGMKLCTAISFEVNYREKSPVIATVIEGDKNVSAGDILLCHHNTFYLPSPYHLEDDLFSIPCNPQILFAKVLPDGNLKPIFDNILVERMKIPCLLPLPPEKQKTYTDRATVIDGGTSRYKKRDVIFHRPFAAYDIVYNLNGIENRVAKVPAEQVCGFVRGK